MVLCEGCRGCGPVSCWRSLRCRSTRTRSIRRRTLSQYVHRIWQVQQGLPQASIYAIVQTHDGYLWLGTQTGLVKFDGVRFTTIDEIDGVSMANIWVTQLLEDDQGSLWIGTDHAGLIRAAEREGHPILAARRPALGHRAMPVQRSQRQRLGVHAERPRRVDAETRFACSAPAHGLSSRDVQAACVMPDGTLHVGGDSARSSPPGTARAFVSRPLGLPESATVQAMLCAADDVLWIGTSDGLIRVRGGREDRLTPRGRPGRRLDPDRDREPRRQRAGRDEEGIQPDPRPRDRKLPPAGRPVAEHGVLAVRGPRRQPVGGDQARPESVPRRPGDSVHDAAKGSRATTPARCCRISHGIIWVGTLGGGLARFDGHRFVALTTRDGLASNSIVALAEDDGRRSLGRHRRRAQPAARRPGHRHLDDQDRACPATASARCIAITPGRSGSPPRADRRCFVTAPCSRRRRSSGGPRGADPRLR